MLRWLIVLYLALTLGVGALKFVFQAETSARMASVEQQLDAARMATHEANALLVLTHEYTLRRSERSASQWATTQRGLADSVAQAASAGFSNEDVEELQAVTANLPLLFESLSRDVPAMNPKETEARRIMLTDQILSETRSLSDLTFRIEAVLVGRLQAEALAFRQRDGLLNWMWLATSLFLCWLLLVRVLRPLEQMSTAAQALKAGDLQARCRYEGHDELGQAAASFNAMVDSLALANERNTVAVESASMGVWDYDLKSGHLVWDNQMFAIYQVASVPPEGTFAVFRQAVHPEDLPHVEDCMQRAISGITPLHTKFRIRVASGQVRYVKADAHVIRDEAGAALRMVGINTDITEQVVTTATLKEQAAMLQRISRLASIGSWRLELGASGPFWDAETCRIHEVPPDFVPDLATAIDFYAPEHRKTITDAVQNAIHTGEGWDLELQLITFTGRTIWVRAMGDVGYVNGKASFLFGAFQDITERREAAQTLQRAKEAAEAASAAKGAFLANMSHEIRTPLNAVLGVAHLLEGSGLNADQQQLLAKAQMAGRSLLDIVNDVLDLAKIEAGELALDEAPFQPRQLLLELQAVHSAQAQAKGLTLSVRTHPEVPDWLQGDSARLRQILHNLVSNALKFTHRGSVQVELAVVEPGAQQARLRWSVRDTGIGIASDVQAGLFQPFIQADASTTRRFGGTGLGLSIVRRLADLMGGQAGVNSAPGQGSEFWLELPMAVLDGAPQHTAGRGRLEVAVMHADAGARQERVSLVQALGWLAIPIKSQADLVSQMARRVQVGEPLPDALLIDGPVSGLEALRVLAGNIGHPRLPATVLTGCRPGRDTADPEHLVDLRVEGIADTSELFNAVNRSILQHIGTTEPVVLSTPPDMALGLWLAGVRVMVVDDSDINLDIARRLLERQGAQVETFASGREALQRLQERPAGIDVVLMDVQMPDMDGLEATRQVRSTLGLRDLPIVALTAGALIEERQRALAAGMDDFLSKPMDPPELLGKLRLFVERHRGQALPLVPASDELTADARPAPPAWLEVAGVDMQQAMSRLSGDWSLFTSILQRLLDDNANLMQIPQQEGGKAWRKALGAQLHKLRGGAGMVGAVDLMQRTMAAEELAATTGAPLLPALQALAQSMRALQAAATPVLQAHSAAVAAAPACEGAEPLRPDERHELLRLLQGQDLDALTWIADRAPSLRATLGAPRAGQLQAAADELDFQRAAQLLTETPAPDDQGLQ